MCFPSGGSSDAAAAARRAEEQRQARIAQGRQAIDETFGQFDDDFFGGIRDDAQTFFRDDLERQAESARKKLIFNLSRGGNINSSAGAGALGDFRSALSRNEAMVADKARGVAQKARGDVERNRSELFSQLSVSADPAAAADAALNRAAFLSETPPFEPLGNLFADFANLGANAIAAERRGFPGTRTGIFAPRRTSDSQQIVSS